MNQNRQRIHVSIALVAAICASPLASQGSAGVPSIKMIDRDIAALTSDGFDGRLVGTAGNDSAVAFLSRRFAALRLESYGKSFLQTFRARVFSGDPNKGRSVQASNVIGLLRGADPALRGEVVLVGAHFDHLGTSTMRSPDPDVAGIRRGADDNASGTAALLELARLLSRSPPRRSVIFVAFSAEEEGLLGSEHFVMHSPVPLARITAMLNFDMVGRLRDSALVISGTGTAKAFPEIIERANADIRLHIIADANGDSPSDQMSFSSHRIPVLFFSTGLHADYHSVRDVASKINLSGETSVVALAERIIRLVGDRETILEFAVSRVRTLQVARPYLGVLLGGAPRSNGVEVAGIMPGSPAAKAGLVVGDIIERLNGVAIYDIGLYNQLLYSRSPRDTLLITLHRHGHQHIVPIQLGLAERD